MTYDLTRLARQAGLRRNRILRPIQYTQARIKGLYSLMARPVRGWEQAVRESILPAYGRAIDGMTRDDESDDIAQIIRIAEALINGRTVQVSAEIEDWLGDAVEWHEQRWAAAVQAGTGIDVFPFINRTDSMARVSAFQRQMTNLVRDISDTGRKDIEQAIWNGLTEQTPRKEIGKQIAERLGIQRRRANRIAIDQAQKLNGELTRIRMEEAGLTAYRWRHSGKVNFRPEHKARNGKVYKIGQPAGDQPGQAIYCGCVSMPVVDVEGTGVDPVEGVNYDPMTAADFETSMEGTLAEGEDWAREAVMREPPRSATRRMKGPAAYHPDQHTIYVRKGLRGSGARAVIRHELGHSLDYQAVWGDGMDTISSKLVRQAADDLAAMAARENASADVYAALKGTRPSSVVRSLGLSTRQRSAVTALSPTDRIGADVAVLVESGDPTLVAKIARSAARKAKGAAQREWTQFADLVGSISRTRYGYGHSAAYYAKFPALTGGYTEAHLAEAFANWFSLTSGPNGAHWRAIIEEFAPEFAKAARSGVNVF